MALVTSTILKSILAFCAINSIDKFVTATGIDFDFRDGTGADPWSIPDWSWAGYAGGGRYKSVLKIKEFNVMDFGAKHDGKADDASAIQAAIDAAGIAGGGTVYLPAGRYLIRNQVTISKSNIVLKGAGKRLTTLYSPTSLSDVVKNGTVIINSIGQSRFSWANGFVKISAQPSYFKNETLLAKVIYGKSRGWTALNVDTPENFKPGMWVRLHMSDVSDLPTNESLASSLYDNKIEKSICGTECIKALRGVKKIRWAVKVNKVEGNKIFLERPLPMDVKPRWNAELHVLPAGMPQDCGVQNLSIHFALQRMQPHLKEAGFNGICVEHAINAWVRNVAVINSDNAVIVRYSHHVTIDGIEIFTNGNRAPIEHNPQGHLGIGLYESADVEVTNFNVKSKMKHDVSVRGTMLCVFHNGSGIDLNLDSHRAAPFATLYSSIDLGKATRVFTSGGSGKNGFPAAAYTTYWNLRAGSGGAIVLPSKTYLGECTYGIKLAFQGNFIGKRCETYYMGKNGTANPTDLFVSQVSRRLSKRV